MWNWIKNLGKKPFENKVQLPKDGLDLLQKDLAPLDKLKSGVSGEVLRFLLDDENESILHICSGLKGGGRAINLLNTDYRQGSTLRSRFLASKRVSDPKFYYRLAQLYDALYRPAINSYHYADILGPHVWLECFLFELRSFNLNRFPRTRLDPRFPVEVVEDILMLDGAEPGFLVKCALSIPGDTWTYSHDVTLFSGYLGFNKSVEANKDIVGRCFSSMDFRQKESVLELFVEKKVYAGVFADCLGDVCIDSSKAVREIALKWFQSVPDQIIPILKERAKTGTADERRKAINAVWILSDRKDLAFLEECLDKEKSKKNIAEIEKMIGGVKIQKSESAPYVLDFEPLEKIEPYAPLSEEAKNLIKQKLEEAKQLESIEYKKRWPKENKCFSKPDYKKLYNLMEEGDYQSLHKSKAYEIHICLNKPYEVVKQLLQDNRLQLLHKLRLYLILFNCHEFIHHVEPLYNFKSYLKCLFGTSKWDLREVANLFLTLGISNVELGRGCLNSLELSSELLKRENWKFFAENTLLLEEVFELRPSKISYSSYWYQDIRKTSYQILQQFPFIPDLFVPFLWEVALDSGKTERPYAKACLSKVDGVGKELLPSLSSNKKLVRAVAAEWLGELNFKEAIPELKKLYKKEKQEEVKSAVLTSLERLGEPVEPLLSEAALIKEAKAVEKKAIPKDIEWLNFEGLPELRFKKNGKKADKLISKWLILRAVNLKAPAPGPLVRRYCSLFNDDDVKNFGLYLLKCWVGYDTRRLSRDEALERANDHAKSYAQWYKDKTHEQLVQEFLPQYLNECVGSAIKSKGLLSLCASACSQDAVGIIEKYLKEWYGKRVHQSKALLHVLSWIEHPSAIQVLLSISKRFRTKSLQKYAEELVLELADRLGWTMDELSDRTIPTAGFEGTPPILSLSYGARSFQVKIDRSLKPLLYTEEGKLIKSLPAARKDEDDEHVKTVKKDLTAAKKTLKAVHKHQVERLYESMCTRRKWCFSDLKTYLLSHPLVGFFCQTLIWQVIDENGDIGKSFRPLEDGTLTDFNDDEVLIAGNEMVCLAHTMTLDEDSLKSWREHLIDYEVTQVFEQLKPVEFKLDLETKNIVSIKDYEGYMIESFKIRSIATKRGYVRGEAQDAGWFGSYEKPFSGLGIRAVIGFTGNCLPEENIQTALLELTFEENNTNDSDYYYDSEQLELKSIPKILLAECLNDMKNMALSGSGYDADWEKKVEYY
jgi:hypothetical protein